MSGLSPAGREGGGGEDSPPAHLASRRVVATNGTRPRLLIVSGRSGVPLYHPALPPGCQRTAEHTCDPRGPLLLP